MISPVKQVRFCIIIDADTDSVIQRKRAKWDFKIIQILDTRRFFKKTISETYYESSTVFNTRTVFHSTCRWGSISGCFRIEVFNIWILKTKLHRLHFCTQYECYQWQYVCHQAPFFICWWLLPALIKCPQITLCDDPMSLCLLSVNEVVSRWSAVVQNYV